jgi:hypothetical protein
MYPTSGSELTTKEKPMTKHKNDAPEPEGGNQAPKTRGGAAGEDRSKDLTPDQSGGLFGNQKEGKTTGEKKSQQN